MVPNKTSRPRRPQWTNERIVLALIVMISLYSAIRSFADIDALNAAGVQYLAVGAWAIAIIGFLGLASAPRVELVRDKIVPMHCGACDQGPSLEILSELERMREEGHMALPAWVKYMEALEGSSPWLIEKARLQAAQHDWKSLSAELEVLDRERVEVPLHFDDLMFQGKSSRYRTHLEQMAPELMALARTQLQEEAHGRALAEAGE